MTTKPTKQKSPVQLPDPPEREPEDMTSFDHLTLSGSVHHLVQHLGNPETTIVAGERYITREPGAPAEGRMAPDLLVAFNADLQAYRDSNGYIISEHSDLLAQRHRNQWLEWRVGQLEQERTEHRTLMEEITSAIRHINPDAYYEYIEQPQPQPTG